MLREDTFAIFDTFRKEDCPKNEDKEIHPKNNENQNNCVIITNSCCTCNGYYGPCFEDSVCPTCHVFLFLNAASTLDRPLTPESSTYSDSGNDEPIDNSQASKAAIYKKSVGEMAPIRVDTLEKELQRLSIATHDDITEINLESFPTEVLMHVFEYLDEISLWRIGQVCRRWREILFVCVKYDLWRDLVRLR